MALAFRLRQLTVYVDRFTLLWLALPVEIREPKADGPNNQWNRTVNCEERAHEVEIQVFETEIQNTASLIELST